MSGIIKPPAGRHAPAMSTAPASSPAPRVGPPSVPRASFEQVFRENLTFAWRALRRLGVGEADVEDVCQEVFLVVHRRLPEFQGRSSVRTWIYGICVRVASEHRRRPHVRRESLGETPDRQVPPPQHEALERRRAVELLDRALDGLEEDKRAIFVLYQIEEVPMNEVAEALGCPLQTAYSRLHAARRHVEAVLRAAEEGSLEP